MMSRFPTIRETFILYEMLELKQRGFQIEIFPLIRQHEDVVHDEVQELADQVHYFRLLSWETLVSQLFWLRHQPARYLGGWFRVLRGTVFSFDFLVRSLLIVPMAAHAARQMQQCGTDHIHAHWATHPALAAFIVHHLTGLPYSFTAHAHDIFVDRTMLEEKIRQASFVVTISHYNQQMLQSLYGTVARDKVSVLHCGIDPTVFQPRPDTPRGDLFIIVCVAGLEERKGHVYLVEACAKLSQQGIPFRCIIVGDGPERATIQAAIQRAGLQTCVHLSGYQTRTQVRELLAAAGAVVLPSITTTRNEKEGIPVALMEALAMELPVVATAQSGIPELIGHEQQGLLVPERDATALADALLRLYHDPDLGVRLGKAGRNKVLQEFHLQQETAKLACLLAQSVEQHHTREEEAAHA